MPTLFQNPFFCVAMRFILHIINPHFFFVKENEEIFVSPERTVGFRHYVKRITLESILRFFIKFRLFFAIFVLLLPYFILSLSCPYLVLILSLSCSYLVLILSLSCFDIENGVGFAVFVLKIAAEKYTYARREGRN